MTQAKACLDTEIPLPTPGIDPGTIFILLHCHSKIKNKHIFVDYKDEDDFFSVTLA